MLNLSAQSRASHLPQLGPGIPIKVFELPASCLQVCAACRRVDSIDRSFFVFSKAKGAKIRPFVLSVVSHKAYKAIMMTIVLTNIVYLGADDPKCDAACLDANPTRKVCAGAIHTRATHYR